MQSIGICGCYGFGFNLLNGQTIKTKEFTKALEDYLNFSIIKVDTYNWKRNPLLLTINLIKMFQKCNNIILLPAQNGIKIFVPLFTILNLFFKRRIIYIVIGGWLPDLLKSNKKLRILVSKLDEVLVEARLMEKRLTDLGLSNVSIMPNFKNLNVIAESDLVFNYSMPYRLCIFSRIMKEKGVEDAIDAVKKINDKFSQSIYELDIFGQIDKDYKNHFQELQKNFPPYITYSGVVPYSQSVDVLKEYFALLFPTYYEGEGFAGTIIDAFSSGIPVIATDWKYNSEIIDDMINGIIYRKDEKELSEVLEDIKENPKWMFDMKLNCIEKAQYFSSKRVIEEFVAKLK